MRKVFLKNIPWQNYKRPFRHLSIFSIIIGCLIFTGTMPGQNKLTEGQVIQLRAAKSVRLDFQNPGGSASHIKFPVVETVRSLFTTAGLQVVPSGGDLVFKIGFKARANSRRYAQFSGGFVQTGYSGASLSGNVFVLAGEAQVLKKNFSGRESTKSAIRRGT